MNEARTWNLLERRAAMRVDEALGGVARARQQMAELDASRQRLEGLLADYAQRLQVLQAGEHEIGQGVMLRNYIGQIEALRNKLDQTRMHVERQVQEAQARHQAAETERARMEFLGQAQQERQVRAEARREMRTLDAVALARHVRTA